MTTQTFHRDNHYVPHVYLKRWASSHKRVWAYRLLVSRSKVPLWVERSIRGVAYQQHLYTRIIGGQETDEFERWMEQEFETPAEESLQKATSDVRLESADWERLVRFLASQDVRTPARLIERFKDWDEYLPGLLEDTLQKSVRKLESRVPAEKFATESKVEYDEYIPLRVKSEVASDQKFGTLRSEIVAGRGLWLFEIKRALTRTAKVLHQCKWTILAPPRGLNWFTSDDPVVRLNAYGRGKYDFNGRWDNPGTEIFLPIGPQHLLYTQVGQRPPRRGEMMPHAQADLVRQFIAEHAHRMIFSSTRDVAVEKLRSRVVDAERLRKENEQWRKWHEDQSAAERELMELGDGASTEPR